MESEQAEEEVHGLEGSVAEISLETSVTNQPVDLAQDQTSGDTAASCAVEDVSVEIRNENENGNGNGNDVDDVDDDDDDDDEQEGQDSWQLGFIDEDSMEFPVFNFKTQPWGDWDGGKVGGFPSWLNPLDLPSAQDLSCNVCSNPLRFLLQVCIDAY